MNKKETSKPARKNQKDTSADQNHLVDVLMQEKLDEYWKKEYPQKVDSAAVEFESHNDNSEEEIDDDEFARISGAILDEDFCTRKCKHNNSDGHCTEFDCRRWEEHNKAKLNKEELARRHLEKVINTYNALVNAGKGKGNNKRKT